MNESMSVSSADAEIQWGVQVELGKIQVVKDSKSGKQFTTFTFRFKIGQAGLLLPAALYIAIHSMHSNAIVPLAVHDFTSRYSRLYKFQDDLSKNERFQKAFN